MKTMWMRKWALRCGALAAGFGGWMLSAAPADDAAGLWELWRVEDGRRVEQDDVLYRLNADGGWDFVHPGVSESAGSFRIEGKTLTLSLPGKNGHDPENLPVKMLDANHMEGEIEGVSVALVRHEDTRKKLREVLSGEWTVYYLTDEKKVEKAAFLLKFRDNGSWEEIPAAAAAAQDFEEQGGTYVIDRAGFLILSDTDGGELVFTYGDSRLSGWGSLSAMFCVHR